MVMLNQPSKVFVAEFLFFLSVSVLLNILWCTYLLNNLTKIITIHGIHIFTIIPMKKGKQAILNLERFRVICRPCEREFHKDVERTTEKYVWKSAKEIRREIQSAFSKYKDDNILPADHEYPAITSRTKMALLKSIAYKYEVDATKKKVACEIKETQVDMSKQQLESMLLSEGLPYKGTTT